MWTFIKNVFFTILGQKEPTSFLKIYYSYGYKAFSFKKSTAANIDKKVHCLTFEKFTAANVDKDKLIFPVSI